MSLIIITEAMKLIKQSGMELTSEDREFVAQYAFRTGDAELVKKLIEEIGAEGADKEFIQNKYLQFAEKKPEWAEQIENTLIALEMYRAEEEKAVKRIIEFLSAHGIEVSEDKVKHTDVGEIKTMVSDVLLKAIPEKVPAL